MGFLLLLLCVNLMHEHRECFEDLCSILPRIETVLIADGAVTVHQFQSDQCKLLPLEVCTLF